MTHQHHRYGAPSRPRLNDYTVWERSAPIRPMMLDVIGTMAALVVFCALVFAVAVMSS